MLSCFRPLRGLIILCLYLTVGGNQVTKTGHHQVGQPLQLYDSSSSQPLAPSLPYPFVRLEVADFDDLPAIVPTDPLYPNQWTLQNMGFVPDLPGFRLKYGADADVARAWSILRGFGSPDVIIAVVDNGFDLNHPDLREEGKIVAPFDVATGGSILPIGLRHGDHATPCATTALGAANGYGIVGAAPNARLMPIHGLTFSAFLTQRIFSHAVENGAAIISCSWGTVNERYQPDERHEAAVRHALTNGRNGKGAIVLFAAGNEGKDEINYYARIPGVIAVGASTSSDTHPSYGNTGYGIDVVAPTDGGYPPIAGRADWDPGSDGTVHDKKYYADGIDRGQHYKHFGGTSHATALVAGICALVLSANPDLTAVQVKQILIDTADKIGNPWEYDENGYSTRYGHGRVNAARAVVAALNARYLDPARL